MDGTSYFPSRPEMEANLASFVERTGLEIRYDCTWTGTRIVEDDPDGERFEVETSDGEYRCGELVVAVGVAEPYSPPGDGMEFTHHYADVRPAATYAGRRVLILGKQNSGFELATGLLPWACQLVLMSPSSAHLSVETRSLVGVRARYVQPFEDHVLGGGVAVLDAALDRIERVEDGDGVLRANLRRSDGGEDVTIEIDDVISATGFVAPLLDLPDLGVARHGPDPTADADRAGGRARPFPASGSRAPSGRAPRASRSTASRPIPGPSTAPGTTPGCSPGTSRRRASASRRLGPPSMPPSWSGSSRRADEAPELWHQRAYLARVFTVDPTPGSWTTESSR